MKKPFDFQPRKGGPGIVYGKTCQVGNKKEWENYQRVEFQRWVKIYLIYTMKKRIKKGDVIELTVRHLRP